MSHRFEAERPTMFSQRSLTFRNPQVKIAFSAAPWPRAGLKEQIR
jgi:hypothetical protein